MQFIEQNETRGERSEIQFILKHSFHLKIYNSIRCCCLLAAGLEIIHSEQNNYDRTNYHIELRRGEGRMRNSDDDQNGRKLGNIFAFNFSLSCLLAMFSSSSNFTP